MKSLANASKNLGIFRRGFNKGVLAGNFRSCRLFGTFDDKTLWNGEFVGKVESPSTEITQRTSFTEIELLKCLEIGVFSLHMDNLPDEVRSEYVTNPLSKISFNVIFSFIRFETNGLLFQGQIDADENLHIESMQYCDDYKSFAEVSSNERSRIELGYGIQSIRPRFQRAIKKYLMNYGQEQQIIKFVIENQKLKRNFRDMAMEFENSFIQ